MTEDHVSKDRRPLLVIIGLLLVMVAIGGWRFSQRNAGGQASGPDQAPASSTLVTLPASKDAVTADQVDWQAAINAVFAAENDAFSNPDPAKVKNFMLPTCDCYADTVNRIRNLQTKSWHVAGNTETLVTSGFVSGTASSITLGVSPASAGNPTVDSVGKVIEQPKAGSAQPMKYVLNKGADGVWRVAERRLLPG